MGVYRTFRYHYNLGILLALLASSIHNLKRSRDLVDHLSIICLSKIVFHGHVHLRARSHSGPLAEGKER